MNTAVETLLESPSLPEIVDQLRARLDQERERRTRFYAEITEGEKAEFINGKVIMHSPAKARHVEIRERLSRLLSLHVDLNRLGWLGGEKVLCAFPRNDYEPDVCFFGPRKAASITPDLLRFPPPDFIAEVLSESTEARDRGEKFEDYAAHGVGEYWIIDPDREILEQYVAQQGPYQLAQKSGTGDVRSVIIPDFCIPVRALFDAQLNLQVLRELLTPPASRAGLELP